MDRRQQINQTAETAEDRVLLARVLDKITTASQREIPAATGFLTARERILSDQLLRQTGCSGYVFFGGPAEAERTVCCYVPEYLDAEAWLSGEDSPICCVRASFRAGEGLTHRDLLGSLMGTGIKRETVGDLYVSDGACDILLLRELLPYVRQNLISAGQTRLTLEEIPLSEIRVPEAQFRDRTDTVPSLRLDSILASGFGLGRAKAAALVESGKVTLNHRTVVKPDKPVAEGDAITARGHGKLKLQAVNGATKKERISVTIRRYL